MKILVVYDQDGTLTSVGVPGRAFGGGVGLIPEPGQQVTELELGNITDDVTDETNLQQLRDVVEQYRIVLDAEQPTLVKKP
jgi:hypothetical protein